MTIYFLKDILSRKKLYLHVDLVKTVNVPQYKNLTLEKILEFAITRPLVERYLPDEPDLPKVPKKWIIDICAGVIGEPFKEWVSE